MKYIFLNFFLFFALFLTVGSLYSQISQGGTPISFVHSNQVLSTIVDKVVKAPSNKYLKHEYENPISSKNDPLTFAYPIYVEYSMDTDGEWLDDGAGGQYWTMAIKSPGAFSLNLLFNKFVLPKTGKLFAYNADKSNLLGAFTYINNREDSTFAISPIEGDEIILEYSQDANESQKPIVSINQVNHDFLGVLKFLNAKLGYGFNKSGLCNVNVQSDPNYNITPQMRSICKILIGGTQICSGTLLTSTAEDSTVFFLSAGHCYIDDPNHVPIRTPQELASSTIFYYNYESPHGLRAVNGSFDFQTSGATLVANSDVADFALLKLTGERPSAMFRPYLSGWNRSSSPPSPSFAIHHPSGDVKKISKTIDPLIPTTFNMLDFLPNNHWQVAKWDSGTTETGSSGCGLFDSGGALVGSLSGGDAVCGDAINDYFVRFNSIWNSNSLSNQQLAFWLDPDNLSTASSPISGRELYGMQNPQRRSNITQLDSGVVKTSTPIRYRSGVYNLSPNFKVAEKFALSSAKNVEGVYLALGKGVTSNSHTISLSFYSGINGPDTLLYTSSSIPISTLGTDKEKFIKLGQPFAVKSGNLYVSYFINSPTAGDTVACYFSRVHKDGSVRPLNTAYLYNGTDWIPYSTQYPAENGSLWIDIITTDDVNTSLENLVKVSSFFDVYPNPATEVINVEFSGDSPIIQRVRLVSLQGVSFALKMIAPTKNGASFAVPNGIKGMYLLQITVNDEVVTRKVLIK